MRTGSRADHYKVLGVSAQASSEEIRRAYRALARKFHPDLNPHGETADLFKRVTEAYEVLSDVNLKAEYDKLLAADRAQAQRAEFRSYQAQNARIREMHERQRTNVAGPKGLSRRESGVPKFFQLFLNRIRALKLPTTWLSVRSQRSSVSIVEVVVTVPESIRGVKKTVELEGRKISLQVPPAVRSGSVIRLRTKTRPVEDVVVIVRLAPHPYLAIHPRGLVAEIPVTLLEITEGAKIRVPTLDSEVVVQIPPGTQSGREICLKGKGIKDRHGRRGDLFLKLIVQVPHTDGFISLAQVAEGMYPEPVRQRLGKRLLRK